MVPTTKRPPSSPTDPPHRRQGARSTITQEAGYSSASEDDALLPEESEDAEFLVPKFLSLKTQIRKDEDSPMASFDDIPAFGASFTDEGLHKKRANFDIPEEIADFLPEKLTPAGSEVSFKPMKEFGTETLVFADGEDDAGSAPDYIDLDLDVRDLLEEALYLPQNGSERMKARQAECACHPNLRL
ncbi:GDCST [Symbiodinium natans]|uniref:GDCST protein n=1 Tax=Symbiodinium natans TaxID=878477 RepID=A0A812KAM5_9DINO|nr:GDCST [Symbiodinium natans]